MVVRLPKTFPRLGPRFVMHFHRRLNNNSWCNHILERGRGSESVPNENNSASVSANKSDYSIFVQQEDHGEERREGIDDFSTA